MIFITTAATTEPAGIYREVLDHARAVFNGEISDPRFLVVDFDLATAGVTDHDDPREWWRANPNIGTTFDLDRLIEMRDRANARGAAALVEFSAMHLNREPQGRHHLGGWLDMASDFDPAVDVDLDVDSIIATADQVAVGVDLGGADDISAVAVVARIGDRVAIHARGFVTRRGLEKRQSVSDLQPALDDGTLQIVEPGQDVREIVDQILEIHSRHPSLICGVDPYGLKAAVQELEAEGVDCVAVPQGWRLDPILSAFERDLLADRITLAPSALMRQHFANASIAARGEARALVKPEGIDRSAKKIDACIATLCAYAALTTAPAAAPSLSLL